MLIFGLNIFIIVASVPTRLQTCAKSVQMHLSGGEGTPSLQPKSNVTFKIAFLYVFEFLGADFGPNYFYYSGHCAHKIANLCKDRANAPFRGWGDTLLATQK